MPKPMPASSDGLPLYQYYRQLLDQEDDPGVSRAHTHALSGLGTATASEDAWSPLAAASAALLTGKPLPHTELFAWLPARREPPPIYDSPQPLIAGLMQEPGPPTR